MTVANIVQQDVMYTSDDVDGRTTTPKQYICRHTSWNFHFWPNCWVGVVLLWCMWWWKHPRLCWSIKVHLLVFNEKPTLKPRLFFLPQDDACTACVHDVLCGPVLICHMPVLYRNVSTDWVGFQHRGNPQFIYTVCVISQFRYLQEIRIHCSGTFHHGTSTFANDLVWPLQVYHTERPPLHTTCWPWWHAMVCPRLLRHV